MKDLRGKRGHRVPRSHLYGVVPMVTGWLVALLSWVVNTGGAAAGRTRRDEDGFTVAEALAMAALGVVTIVAFWALMKALGVDIINKIRENILSGGS